MDNRRAWEREWQALCGRTPARAAPAASIAQREVQEVSPSKPKGFKFTR